MKKGKAVRAGKTRGASPPRRCDVVTLGAKGRVVIPAQARRALGLKKGDSLAVEVEGSRLVLATRRARLEALDQDLRKILKPSRPGESYVDELDRDRDEEAAAE